MAAVGLPNVAAFEHALLPICMAMTERGMLVEDALRLERISELSEDEATLAQSAQHVLTPELLGRLAKPQLIVKRRVCKGCRNGKKKKLTCAVCGGAGEFVEKELNLNSEAQLKDVLYKGLRLPERRQHGKVTTDEEALQSLVALDKSGLVATALQYAKLDTIRGIRDAILSLARDPRVRPRMKILVDMEGNTYVPPMPKAYQLVKLFRSQGAFQANPVALVISRDEHYGLANMVALIGSTGGTPMRVFTGRRDAEEWLRSLAPGG